MPISKYNSVQAGPKIQLGGAKKGLFNVAYHVGMAAMVKSVPRIPTNSQPTIEMISLGRSFIYRKYELSLYTKQWMTDCIYELNVSFNLICSSYCMILKFKRLKRASNLTID